MLDVVLGVHKLKPLSINVYNKSITGFFQSWLHTHRSILPRNIVIYLEIFETYSIFFFLFFEMQECCKAKELTFSSLTTFGGTVKCLLRCIVFWYAESGEERRLVSC